MGRKIILLGLAAEVDRLFRAQLAQTGDEVLSLAKCTTEETPSLPLTNIKALLASMRTEPEVREEQRIVLDPPSFSAIDRWLDVPVPRNRAERRAQRRDRRRP